MKILIFGGGWQQLPVIWKAKQMGLWVLVADYLEDAPGRRKADVFYRISTTEREKILELARSEKIDGILAFASYPLLVKPLDSSGSKGITLLRESDPQRLLAYRNALLHSRSGKG